MKTAVLFLCLSVALISQEAHSNVLKSSFSCPDGWTKIGGRCFLYVPRTMNWGEAEKNCVANGGNLASVHSVDEYHGIQRMIVKITHAYNEAWLGGSDSQTEGVWLWSDGTPFHKHVCGGFDNYSNQDCLQMNYGDQKCFDDVSCAEHRPSVCAKKAKRSKRTPI